MAIADASRYSLPRKLSTISANFQTVTELSGLFFITHESEEGHVNGRHSEVKSLKMQAKVPAKAIENLHQITNI